MIKRIFSAFLLIAGLLFFAASCANNVTNDVPAVRTASNTFTVNGIVHDIASVIVYYWTGGRGLVIAGTDAYLVYITLHGFGDPALTANQIPMGTWTELNAADFVDVVVPTSNTNGNYYDDTATYSNLSLTVGGTQGTTVTIQASFVFTAPTTDALTIDYSGPYDYLPD